MKKNILIVVYAMEIGGIERSLINMLENFDYDAYNVDLFILHHSGEFLDFIPNEVNILPEKSCYTVFRKSLKQSLAEGYYLPSIVKVISKGIASIKAKKEKFKEGAGYVQMQLEMKYNLYFMPKLKKSYDAAISYAWPHDLVIRNIQANKKIAWIHTDYSQLEVDHKLDFQIWKQFDSIAAVSEDCRTSFLKTYPSLEDKVKVIENITSPDFVNKMSSDQQIVPFQQDTFNILSVGRLSYVKGFDLAVQALKILHSKGYTNMKWFVVGYGGYEQELRTLIKENELVGHFILLGKQMNPYPFIKACDLYVQPSRYEGKAVTVTEAKILKKPILITDYPTSKSQVQNGVDGIICEFEPEILASEIEHLYKNPILRKELTHNLTSINFSNRSELQNLYQLLSY